MNVATSCYWQVAQLALELCSTISWQDSAHTVKTADRGVTAVSRAQLNTGLS